ncbi:MAG: VOC family protein [Solirubrobacteraceae bacterium]
MTDSVTSAVPGPAAPPRPAIAAATAMGAVSLTVSNRTRSQAFYENAIGLVGREDDHGVVSLAAPDGTELVRLYEDAAAPALDPRATGLFHLAILLPSRVDLGHALIRLAEARWGLDGASDHLVSEALYLSDPDGNGIEIYRDRPRDEWRYTGDQLEMATLPLDLRSIVSEATAVGPAPATAPAATVMGHVHLQVSELNATEAFYAGVLGFDVTVRGYPGALFVSAGGYHHHLGLNTWNSRGSGPAAPGAVGLRSYEVRVPDETELQRVLDRVRSAGLSPEPDDRGIATVVDPSGNRVALTTA